MITKISIENFKCIGERVEIPIKPLTLLFGANSAGKSTIIQAIHYAREILERQNLDAGKTVSGGGFVDLGGFKNFIHKNDLEREICLRFDFEIDENEMDDYIGDNPYLNRFEIREDENNFYLGDMYYQFGELTSGWVEIVVAHSLISGEPFVKKYSSGINGQLIADILYEAGRPEAEVKNINITHPIFEIYADIEGNNAVGFNLAEAAFARCGEVKDKRQFADVTIPFATNEQNGAIPMLDQKFAFPSLLPEIDNEDVHEGPKTKQDLAFSDDRYVTGMTLTALLSQYIIGPGNLLKKYLCDFRYIGPLREKPDRNYKPPRYLEVSRWAEGLAAWDVLYYSDNSFVDMIGHKLAELETGYTVKKEESVVIPKSNYLLNLLATNEAFDLEEDEIRAELNKFPTIKSVKLLPIDNPSENSTSYPYQVSSMLNLLPQDVGEGITQVLPILVACLDSDNAMIAIEQPELHLHPKQQAELGDLLIESTMQHNKRLFIETHSEHLILRLLRRIRESNNNTNKVFTVEGLSVLYIEQKNGQVEVFNMEVDDKGEFLTSWPDTFFEQDFIERFGQDV